MSFDISALIRAVRRWWWLLLLAPLVGGGALYFYGKAQQPMYQATALIWLQMPPGAVGPDPSVIQEDIDLAEMYRYLVTVEPVLAPVVDDLGLPYDVDTLRGLLTVSVVRGTPLLELSATDADPDRAAKIADAVAHQFSASIARLGVQDTATAAQNPAAPAGVNLAVRLVPAEIPQEPFTPRMKLLMLFGAVLGLLLASGGIALVEYVRRYYKPFAKPMQIHDAPRVRMEQRL